MVMAVRLHRRLQRHWHCSNQNARMLANQKTEGMKAVCDHAIVACHMIRANSRNLHEIRLSHMGDPKQA